MRPPRIHHRGFTLLELLVAIAVFSVLAVMAYGTLSSVLQAQSQTGQSAAELHRMQQTILHLERDVLQIVARPIRNRYGMFRQAMVGEAFTEFKLEFTRTGHPNPNLAPRSYLQRVAYVILPDEPHKLYRYVWPSLDRADGAEPQKQLLLDDVEEMIVRFYDDQGEESTEWPTPLMQQSGQPNNYAMPQAIKVVLKTKSMGEIWRQLEIPRG